MSCRGIAKHEYFVEALDVAELNFAISQHWNLIVVLKPHTSRPILVYEATKVSPFRTDACEPCLLVNKAFPCSFGEVSVAADWIMPDNSVKDLILAMKDALKDYQIAVDGPRAPNPAAYGGRS